MSILNIYWYLPPTFFLRGPLQRSVLQKHAESPVVTWCTSRPYLGILILIMINVPSEIKGQGRSPVKKKKQQKKTMQPKSASDKRKYLPANGVSPRFECVLHWRLAVPICWMNIYISNKYWNTVSKYLNISNKYTTWCTWKCYVWMFIFFNCTFWGPIWFVLQGLAWTPRPTQESETNILKLLILKI